MTSFLAVDWERYSGRPVNRAHTVRRPKKGRENISKFFGQGRVLEGEVGDERFKRDGSEAPVFANAGMVDSMYANDSILNASVLNSTGALDWDVQSGFSAGTRPSTVVGVPGGMASVPGTPRDAVFVLMEDEAAAENREKAEVGEKKAVEEEKREGGGVGSAI